MKTPLGRLLFLSGLVLMSAFCFGQRDGVTREQMWYAPTATDWKKPCLIQWQRTWEDAKAVSRETGKAILLCINMDGEIASEHYAGIRYRQPDIAKLYKPYVTVIASTYRHTPRDYDEKGNRIPCPRFGGVTCGEHIEIEPILFKKYMEGQRVAPRHIMVELDGKESYDVYYAFDTESVFKAISDGITNRPTKPKPLVRGDRTVIEKVASRDSDDRSEVEKAYLAADKATQRAMLEAAISNIDKAPIELLRLAVFGFDAEMSTLARQALTQATTPSAVDLISEALRVPMQPGEKKALIEAMERIGKAHPKARRLAVVYRGLGSRSETVQVDQWSKALEGAEATVTDRDTIASRLRNQEEVFEGRDADKRVGLAEAFLARAVEASTAKDDRLVIHALLEDARNTALEAEQLGATGWKVNTVLAVAEHYLQNIAESYKRAEAAVDGMPESPTGWNSMVVLGLFAEMRTKAISDAVKNKKDWPGNWLTDVHAAYNVLVKHPHGDDTQVQVHHDFLIWLGAKGQASRALTRGLERFPDSWGLHERLRRRTLRERGARGLERVYAEWMKRKDAPEIVRWYAGLGSFVAAEFHRRGSRIRRALQSYEHSIELFTADGKTHAERKASTDHYIALAHGGRARIAFEAHDDQRCLDEILASFKVSPDSANTLDGLSLSTVDTAKMLRARLREEKKAKLEGKLQTALDGLDPRMLELPAYEGAGPGRGGTRGGRRGNRPRRRRDN